MKSKTIIYSIVVIILVSASVYGLIRSTIAPGKYDTFANCLTDNGFKMYGTDWCKFCKNQKAIFGKSFKYINYINCDLKKDACNFAGVEGYPTWIINEKKYSGVQSLERLSDLSGCNIE